MMGMGPNGNTPNFNRNMAPRPNANMAPTNDFNRGANYSPGQNVERPTSFNTGPENFNQAPNPVEYMPSMNQIAPPPQTPPPASTPQPEPTQQTTETNKPKTTDADDFERVWVDKVKTIISNNQGNPRRLQHAVADLTVQYLDARYGKIVGKKV